MIYAVISLSAVLVVFIYSTINLMLKVEKYEDILERQSTVLESLYLIITESGRKLRNLDRKGTFEADDEIGFFFDSVKSIQEGLESYIKEDAQKEEQS